MILLILDYNDYIRDCLSQKDAMTLQWLQNLSLKNILCVNKMTSTAYIHNKLEYDMLTTRCKKHTATNMYKVEHGIMPTTVTSLFTRVAHKHTTRSVTSGNFYVPRRRLEYGKRCFTYHGSQLWKDIPVVNKHHLESFKKELDKLPWTERAIT